MSNSHSPTPPNDPSKPPQLRSSSQIRLLVLLGLLVLMLGALWYDYKVARPAVENAYERIAQLNLDINSKGGKKSMTNQDVQSELKRAPFDTFTEGGYMVEVYGWRGGLPTKRHKYFAVYSDASPYIFLKHYKNEIDMEEIKKQPIVASPGANAATTDLISTDIPPAGGGEPKQKEDGAGAESPTPGDSEKEKAAPSDSKDSPKKEPAAESSEADPAKEKPATENTQPKG